MYFPALLGFGSSRNLSLPIPPWINFCIPCECALLCKFSFPSFIPTGLPRHNPVITRIFSTASLPSPQEKFRDHSPMGSRLSLVTVVPEVVLVPALGPSSSPLPGLLSSQMCLRRQDREEEERSHSNFNYFSGLLMRRQL